MLRSRRVSEAVGALFVDTFRSKKLVLHSVYVCEYTNLEQFNSACVYGFSRKLSLHSVFVCEYTYLERFNSTCVCGSSRKLSLHSVYVCENTNLEQFNSACVCAWVSLEALRRCVFTRCMCTLILNNSRE
jgi:hypothetical protein